MRLVFRGVVQGVGFRPAVFRLASSLGCTGFVQNRRSEVAAEVQGDEEAVRRFERRVADSLPPAACVESIDSSIVDLVPNEGRFRISESVADAFAFPPIPPDLPICPECARELLDPGNRRYLYPFITCTQCGPRYSIVERTPFDRENTSMKPFLPCEACAAEYADPADRRFHSQTNSCAACGPRLVCVDARGEALPGDPLRATVEVLRHGGIAAVQGIGGFHLAVDPRHTEAVERLRQDKERARKPFALMVRDIEEARTLCAISPREEEILASAEAPILIASRRDDAPGWMDHVSDTDTLGIMLPYTPLHLLLFRHPGADGSCRHLIMTSGNRAREPIVTDPEAALRKLSADIFLFHDRRIVFRTDDSILRAGPSSPPFSLRRSRGFVPRLIRLARPVRGVVLALGGDLKSAPALARGRDVHLCPFIGDLEDDETYVQLEEQIRQVLELYGATPDLVVHDMHPLYRSTAWALSRSERRVAVQHHFAHALSVMAEHGLDEALALSFDGTGYGTDGTIWGGEFLHATRAGFTRLGSFAPFRLPGGDAAIRHPPRIALSLLVDRPDLRVPGIERRDEALLRSMLERGINAPVSTSLGRIFDAAAAILGLVDEALYEGEGPIRLEGKALRVFRTGDARMTPHQVEHLAQLMPFLPAADGRLFLVDPRPLLVELCAGRESSQTGRLALLFHEGIAVASLEGARRMRKETSLSRIVLSGGVFQNVLLRELIVPPLIKEGFEVFLNEKAPPGDGGLSVGQAWFEERKGYQCVSPLP